MTRKELEKKLEELERREFFLAMKDRWDRSDFELNRKLAKEIREVKEELENVK